ncbi:MAG: hypothetical protein RLZZ600_685 [Actinomycetota bacterium]|jgi:hypothetical protein
MTSNKKTPGRGGKRVTWKPDNDVAAQAGEPAADTFAVAPDDEGASARPQSNDDRLRADKPPHWG